MTARQLFIDNLHTGFPIEQWGKDHWSTFAYVETRIVDYKGEIDNNHLRVDFRRHPAFAVRRARFGGDGSNGDQYPTLLRPREDGEKGLATLPGHDDVDCILDAVTAGLLEEHGTGLYPIFRMTKLGSLVAGELRLHKGRGGNFCEFMPSPELIAESKIKKTVQVGEG